MQDTLCPTYTQHGKKDLDTCLFSLFWLFLTVLFLFKVLLDCLKLLQDFFFKKGETKTWSYFYCVIFMLLQLLMNKSYILCFNDKKEHCIAYRLENNTRCSCLIFFQFECFYVYVHWFMLGLVDNGRFKIWTRIDLL